MHDRERVLALSSQGGRTQRGQRGNVHPWQQRLRARVVVEVHQGRRRGPHVRPTVMTCALPVAHREVTCPLVRVWSKEVKHKRHPRRRNGGDMKHVDVGLVVHGAMPVLSRYLLRCCSALQPLPRTPHVFINQQSGA